MAHRVEADGAVLEGGKSRFANQNLPGTPGTVDPAESSNMFQEEICNIVEMTGGTIAASAAADRAAGWHQCYDAIFEGGNIGYNAISTDLKTRIGNGTKPPQATINDLCGGLVIYQTHNPAATPNALVTSATWVDSCIGWDAVKSIPYIIVTNGTYITPVIGCWDYSGSPVLDDDLELTFSATPDHIGALCCDADYLYVMWCLESGNWQVSKFAQSSGRYTGSPLWTADTGSAWSGDPHTEVHAMCIADSTHIAAMVSNGDVNERKICIITTTSGAVASGTGSWVSGAGDKFASQNKKLVSDGTHVFWIQYQGVSTVEYFLMSAKISNPTTSDYASAPLGTFDASYPYTFPHGICRVGEGILISAPNGKVQLYSTTDGAVYGMFDFGGTGFLTSDYLGDQDVVIGFDGQNVWLHFVITDTGHARQTNILRKIPAGIISYRGDSGNDYSIYTSAVILNVSAHEDVYVAGKLLFDGLDMWFVTRDGNAYRVVNPGGR